MSRDSIVDTINMQSQSQKRVLVVLPVRSVQPMDKKIELIITVKIKIDKARGPLSREFSAFVIIAEL